jgi:hypothetical protein
VFSAEIQANAIRLYQSAFLVLEGLEVAQSYKSGVVLNGTTDSELRNLWVHDIDGVDNDNLAGIYLVDHNNVRIHHSLIHDNYDRTNSDTGGNKTENSRNIVLFSGGTVRIDHNVIFQSPPITDLKRGGVCITYKHAAKIAGAIFEVDHNILWNCSSQSIGSGSPGTRIHHNLILDSDPIRFADFGGPTYLQDMRVENNTIIRGYGLSYQATTAWGPIGLTTVRRNIISDVYPYGADFRGMHRIDPYGSNTLYTDVVQGGKLSFLENCYYNPNYSLSFALFSANTTSTNNLGGTYTFSGWQGIGYDTTSVNTNPTFDTSFTPQSPACAPYGWLAP